MTITIALSKGRIFDETLPSIWMRAPRRTSSFTCMKRFSKIVSVTLLAPCEMQLSAMNWACMSVGKPGYSVVRKFCARRNS